MSFGGAQGTGGGQGSSQSVGNTTAAALGSAATFTGAWEKVATDGVTVSCKADNSGTLYFDFSNDGTNVDTFPSSGFAVASGIHEYHVARVNSRFFRVRMVNDTGAQSYLRLYTYYGTHTAPNAPMNQTLGADADATIVRFQDPSIDLALGRLGGVQEVDKFGHVVGLDKADAAADVWDYADDGGGGTPVHPFPTASAVAYLASSSGSDTVPTIYIDYIDANGAAASGTYTVTGQAEVTLPSMLHVNRAYNTSATAAVGNITISHDADWTTGAPDDLTQTLAYIAIASGQTAQVQYVVPTGKKAVIKRVYAAMSRESGAAGSAKLTLRVRPTGASWRVQRHIHVTSAFSYDRNIVIVLDAGDAITLRVEDASDTDTHVQGEIDFDLVTV
jgi:hypothetical protein